MTNWAQNLKKYQMKVLVIMKFPHDLVRKSSNRKPDSDFL